MTCERLTAASTKIISIQELRLKRKERAGKIKAEINAAAKKAFGPPSPGDNRIIFTSLALLESSTDSTYQIWAQLMKSGVIRKTIIFHNLNGNQHPKDCCKVYPDKEISDPEYLKLGSQALQILKEKVAGRR